MIDYDLLAYSYQDIYVYQGENEHNALDKDIPTFEIAIKSRQFKTMVIMAFSTTCNIYVTIQLVLCYMFLG